MAEGRNNQLYFYDNALLFEDDDQCDDLILTESNQCCYFDYPEELGKKDALVDKAKLREYLKCEGALHGLNRYINESFEGWQHADLHIGIFGTSGSGKSSLINALRNVKDTDKIAAKVDIEEVGYMPTPYRFPKNNCVILWDIPGLGTELYPQDQYTLEKLEISKFEVVLVVFCTRLNSIDFWLADKCFKAGCSVLFVRTKIDHDVTDSSERMSKDKCLKEIREKTIAKLNSHKFPSKTEKESIDLFMVSSLRRQLYDFEKLTNKLEKLLRDRATRLISQIEPIVFDMIDMEQKSNNERYLGRKLYAAVYGFLPLPVLETVLGGLSMEEIVKESKRKFHLDDKSLDDIPSMLDESKENVDKELACRGQEGDDGNLRRQKTEGKTWGTFRKYSKYMLPGVGSVLSSAKEYKTTEICISELSNELAKDLKKLVEMRLRNLQRDLTPKFQ